MSATDLSLLLETRPQSTDDRLVALLEQISSSVVDLLKFDPYITISAADLSVGLQTLKTATDTAWRLAEKGRIEADVKLVLADVEKIKAGTEKMIAEKM